nr:39S ribosomal protein L30, mitochondrial-like [Lytechinus pictus]
MNLPGLKTLMSQRVLQAYCTCVRMTFPVTRSLSSHPSATDKSSVDGEKEPHLLHAVWRIRSLKRRPYWERDIMKQLKLADTRKPVIHKNTPLVNSLLTRVRHLIRIKPVNPVYGMPDGDYEDTLLKWNGDFIVKRKIEPHGEEKTAAISDGAHETKS